MSAVLTIRMAPQKLARLSRRAVEAGQDRSAYVRGLIDQDLQSAPKPRQHIFASEDLIGCVRTGIANCDNATVRKIVRQRLLDRAKNR